MAKINPPRKRRQKIFSGIPFRSEWRFFGRKYRHELSDSEFQQAIGAARYSPVERFLFAVIPLMLGGLLYMADIAEPARFFVVIGLVLLVLYGINWWLEAHSMHES